MSEGLAIPAGWTECQLGDLVLNPKADLVDGPFGSNLKSDEYVDSGVPVLKIQNIKANRFVRTSLSYITSEKAAELSRHSFIAGDLVITKLGQPLGLCCEVPADVKHGVIVADLMRLRPCPKVIYSPFLLHAINSVVVQNQFKIITKGTTRQRVNLSIVRSIRILLPPLAEQRRIVAKIEELFSELDKGIENLKQAQAQLAVYRQALLKHAFEGKLTTDWRKANADKLESADQLLARIRAQRQSTYKKKLLEWATALRVWEATGEKGPKPGKPREPKNLRPLDETFRQKMALLPSSWAWDVLGSMTIGVEYGSAAKSSGSGTHVVLRMGNLQNGKLDWGDLAFSSSADEVAQYLLRPGDVLFNRTNSPEWVGKTSIYKGERPALFAGYLIRVNNSTEVVLGEYLNWFLNSPVAKQHGNAVKTDGVNQSNINGDKLMNYPFPYCSLAEQEEIVRLLEATISLIDRSAEDLDTNLQKAEALRQSILKTAFAGQLVPQDPDDEPAAELLARIRAERASRANGHPPPISRRKNRRSPTVAIVGRTGHNPIAS